MQNQKFLTSAKVEKYDWRVVVNNNETSETSEQETEKSKDKKDKKLACRWGMTILSKSHLPLFAFNF